jgi:predicted small lipoprotein YifL
MRFSIVLLMCLMSLACGKTGALYLPEEPADQGSQVQEQKPVTEEKTD